MPFSERERHQVLDIWLSDVKTVGLLISIVIIGMSSACKRKFEYRAIDCTREQKGWIVKCLTESESSSIILLTVGFGAAFVTEPPFWSCLLGSALGLGASGLTEPFSGLATFVPSLESFEPCAVLLGFGADDPAWPWLGLEIPLGFATPFCSADGTFDPACPDDSFGLSPTTKANVIARLTFCVLCNDSCLSMAHYNTQ